MLDYFTALIVLVLLLIFTVAVFFYASGLCEKIVVSVKCPPYLSKETKFAFKIHDGSYDEVGYLFTEAHSVYPSCVQCGIHFEEDSEDTSTPKQSAVGSLVNEEDGCVEAFKKAGFQITQLPAVDEAIVASFPHASVLSIVIGSKRVYSQMKSYIQAHNLKVSGFVEVYDGSHIHYIGLLKDADKFRLSSESPTESQAKAVCEDQPIETLSASDELPSEPEQPSSQGENADLDELEATFEKITDLPNLPVSS